jgi:hypothetical protein
MDSVLRQPLRVVRNLAARSSERSGCLGRPAQRGQASLPPQANTGFYYHVKTSAGISPIAKLAQVQHSGNAMLNGNVGKTRLNSEDGLLLMSLQLFL